MEGTEEKIRLAIAVLQLILAVLELIAILFLLCKRVILYRGEGYRPRFGPVSQESP